MTNKTTLRDVLNTITAERMTIGLQIPRSEYEATKKDFPLDDPTDFMYLEVVRVPSYEIAGRVPHLLDNEIKNVYFYKNSIELVLYRTEEQQNEETE